MSAIDRITNRLAAQQPTAMQQSTSAVYLGISGGYAVVQTPDRDRVQVPAANITTNGALRVGQQIQLSRPLGGQPFIKAQVR